MKLLIIRITCLFFLAMAIPAFSQGERQLIDLEFNGGTVAEFVSATKDLNLNVVVPDKADEMRLQTIKVRNVEEDDLFTALNIMGVSYGLNKFVWRNLASENNPNYPGSKNVWVLMEAEPPPKSEPMAMPIAVSFLVKGESKSRGYTIEQITTAIKETVAADYKVRGRDGEDKISFQYHEDTKLLIVSGEKRAVDLAMITVSSLKDSLVAERD